MDKLTASWVEATKNALRSLQSDYKNNKGLILTEGDLECHLFSRLLQQPELTGFHESANENARTSKVHSQVTWFRPERSSGFEVDITLCNPKYLKALDIELIETFPSKGFIYDGECVAIEVKFIRHLSRFGAQVDEDFLNLRDELIPSKLKNIEKLRYKRSSPENIAFISIVGCKDTEIFEKAKIYLGKHISNPEKPCPANLFVFLFYQDEIILENTDLVNYYHEDLKMKLK